MALKKGYTLMHEHLTIDLAGVKKDEDCILDCYEETVSELKKLYDLGVRNIVDVTNIGIGRNTAYVARAAKETGIRIIQSTGFYKEPFFPDCVREMSTEELAALMEHEILDGIGDTGIQAEMIGEIGTSHHKMEPMEAKVFDAAALVAKKTGKPIYTHTTLGTYAKEQVTYLLDRDVSPEKIVIGHMDLCGDLSYIQEVLGSGVFIGFDTVGKNNYFPDQGRVDFLMALAQQDLLGQVVLSMDLTRKSHLAHKGGIGYAYLFEVFLPMLRKAGMKESDIEKIFILNPEKIFA